MILPSETGHGVQCMTVKAIFTGQEVSDTDRSWGPGVANEFPGEKLLTPRGTWRYHDEPKVGWCR